MRGDASLVGPSNMMRTLAFLPKGGFAGGAFGLLPLELLVAAKPSPGCSSSHQKNRFDDPVL